jgi:hypothetical protein
MRSLLPGRSPAAAEASASPCTHNSVTHNSVARKKRHDWHKLDACPHCMRVQRLNEATHANQAPLTNTGRDWPPEQSAVVSTAVFDTPLHPRPRLRPRAAVQQRSTPPHPAVAEGRKNEKRESPARQQGRLPNVIGPGWKQSLVSRRLLGPPRLHQLHVRRCGGFTHSLHWRPHAKRNARD